MPDLNCWVIKKLEAKCKKLLKDLWNLGNFRVGNATICSPPWDLNQFPDTFLAGAPFYQLSPTFKETDNSLEFQICGLTPKIYFVTDLIKSEVNLYFETACK